ncbi:MAG: hypothetical protein DHS20C13_25360 [Thermodesulfobacteriota bacterium]|nr:MAG: hypothetical protein DHS20C13_25360 [Thermodesulfobacteriota bacterium]GJM36343.1 MAG: hypothetical protein DHS20C18_53440 [Saprospiraceae bacterium]
MKVKYSNGVIAEVKDIRIKIDHLPTQSSSGNSIFKEGPTQQKIITYLLKLKNNSKEVTVNPRINVNMDTQTKKVSRWRRFIANSELMDVDGQIKKTLACLNNYSSIDSCENDTDLRYFFENIELNYEIQQE